MPNAYLVVSETAHGWTKGQKITDDDLVAEDIARLVRLGCLEVIDDKPFDGSETDPDAVPRTMRKPGRPPGRRPGRPSNQNLAHLESAESDAEHAVNFDPPSSDDTESHGDPES